MGNRGDQMIIAKDHFWTWAMMSLREAEVERSSDRMKFSFFTARNAIYHTLRLLQIPRGSQVLVPAYICRAAVDPFLAYGAAVTFYRVNRNCEPDFEDLERKIVRETKAVMAVHYFGF